jgi:thymidylate synthase
MLNKSYHNARQAFEDLYDIIMNLGEDRNGTKTMHNVLIELRRPESNVITTKWRRWNLDYAMYEFQWYLSGNPNAEQISKRAKIWANMMDEQGNVNSNYGYQWKRNNQLDKVIDMLKNDPLTRRASISLYDGKEIDQYKKDTICTYAINFYIDVDDRLSMQVMMRSNDLVYGFCNDQYCFSELQKIVAKELNRQVGKYYHYVCNMHIYERHYKMKETVK